MAVHKKTNKCEAKCERLLIRMGRRLPAPKKPRGNVMHSNLSKHSRYTVMSMNSQQKKTLPHLNNAEHTTVTCSSGDLYIYILDLQGPQRGFYGTTLKVYYSASWIPRDAIESCAILLFTGFFRRGGVQLKLQFRVNCYISFKSSEEFKLCKMTD